MGGPVLVLASADFGESYILEWVGLVAAVALVWRYGWPHLARAMSAQADRIRASLEAGEAARTAAERAVEVEREAVAAAHKEAEALLDQARHSADQLLEDGRRRAEEEYSRLVARAETEVTLERSRARDEISAELSAVVLRFASQIVEAELDGANQRRLVDQAIEAVESEAVR